MIVCSCFGTTDREVRAAFGPGGDGRCPAGRACGGCVSTIEDIVAHARDSGETDARIADPRAIGTQQARD